MKEENEIWMPLDKFYGYEVSNKGHVKSISYHNQGISKLLKPCVIGGKNYTVTFCLNGKVYKRSVKYLVAQAFMEDPGKAYALYNINGDVTDCRVENLEFRKRNQGNN